MRRLLDNEAARLRELVRKMTTLSEQRGYEFDSAWVEQHGWVVVPVENTGHLAEEEIDRIVPALNSTGHLTCVAIGAIDLPDPLPTVYELAASHDDLRAFNGDCGAFRFLLTDRELSWAISCNEWFNLFAGYPPLIEQMLGASIRQAREEFLEYATVVEQGSEGRLVQIARQYIGD